jgi:hypothetical protein
MSNSNTPHDGNFAALFETQIKPVANNTTDDDTFNTPTTQSIHDVLSNHAEPSAELLEELSALENAPPLTDEEIEKQALEHPGADGDPQTPE